MQHLRRILLAAALLVSAVPTFAQAPAPVPALPDSERRTSYSITATNCACAVNMALFGDGSDYQNWVEVFLNNVRVNYNDATFGWTITSPSGPIANLARPISNAVLTFNSVQTGTVQIVGARRPRRTSQFSENRGVAARDLNQALTDIIAQNREIWDKTNDMTGRAMLALPGENLGLLPAQSARAGKLLVFDGSGNPGVTSPTAGLGNVLGPATSTVGNIATYNNTTGTLLADSPPPCSKLSNAAASCSTDATNASNISTGTLATARGGTGSNTSTNSPGQLLTPNGANGVWVTTTINAICTLSPGLCAKVVGYVNIAWYGAVCDGVTNDLTAIQNAWNAAATLNVDVWLGAAAGASCNLGTGGLVMPTPVALPSSSSAFSRVPMLKGPGSALVRLISTGTGTNCAITMSATYGVNSSLGGVMGGFGIFQGNTNQTARGLCLNNITFLNIDDFATSFFGQGILAIDCIIINISHSWFEFNANGMSAQFGTTTPPNAWSVRDSTFVSQKQYSIFLAGSATAGAKNFNISGNNFQSDGATAGFCSIFNQGDATPYGGLGLNIVNNYFEGNGGCEIQFSQAASTSNVGNHNVIGNHFVRSLTALTQGIVINNNGSGTAKTTVNVIGNGFSDVLLTGVTYQWLLFTAPATFNATFICQGNTSNVAASINSRCGAVAATKTMTSDANAQWVGFN